jgi:hypothetical protein
MPELKQQKMSWQRVLSSLLAGFVASMVHIGLMELKHRSGIMPTFEPHLYVQALLLPLKGALDQPGLLHYLPDINGGMLLGFAFGRLFTHLPGATFVVKGLAFAVGAWLLLGLVVFPLGGQGLFASATGLGVFPAVLMLVMVASYSIIMSFIYTRLTLPHG